jgi:4-carboxymuconolactone decarboxylase
MRLKPIPPASLSAEQQPLYDSMKQGIDLHLTGFVSATPDGALVGPFNPMLHFPQFGKAAWEYTVALIEHSTLPKPAHEVAILVTGARFVTRYELYAHERVGARAGLSDQKIATIAAGERPPDLTPEEAAAYDVAARLSKGGTLPESTYQAALQAFGEQGTAELIYLVAGYAMVSMMLNGWDISVPGSEEGLPQG